MASSFEVPAGGDQLFRTQLLAPEGQPSRAEAALGEDVETRAAAAAAPAIWEKAPRRVVVAGSAVQADEAARRVARVVIRSIMVREGFCLILWGGGEDGGRWGKKSRDGRARKQLMRGGLQWRSSLPVNTRDASGDDVFSTSGCGDSYLLATTMYVRSYYFKYYPYYCSYY